MSDDLNLAKVEGDPNADVPWIAERTLLARSCGLDMEIIYFSLAALKMNPNLSIREAVEAACQEWDA